MGMFDKDIQADQREWLLDYVDMVMKMNPKIDKKIRSEIGEMPEDD